MEFSINLCFTGLHLRWPPEFGFICCRKLNITFIHEAPQLLSHYNSHFFYTILGLRFDPENSWIYPTIFAKRAFTSLFEVFPVFKLESTIQAVVSFH